MTHKMIQPADWAVAKGYANGVLSNDGRLAVAGQIGWNEQQVFDRADFLGQMDQALHNVLAVVRAAGGEAADIVRMTWYITDKGEYLARQKEVGAIYRKHLGRHYPAMAMVVVAGLIEDVALIEIEADAILGRG